MTEPRSWRVKALKTGVALAWINPIYFIVSLYVGGAFHLSDRIAALSIFSGILVGLSTLTCGLIGEGGRRWVLIPIALVETLIWWFMSVGL